MKPLIENSVLTTDLDCAMFDLLNVGIIDPPPANLVASTDPRLTDSRVPPTGSITNSSVSPTAAIQQSKLNLNGSIPGAWLGNSASQAAQGNLVEYAANKAKPLGYASLDSGGKVPSAQLPSGIGAGTVTSVGLTMPAQFSITGSPVTGSGTLSAAWANAPASSWFGNPSLSPAVPQFNTTPVPSLMIPNLDASQVVSGVFAVARIPLAVGMGAGHASGAVPDPGSGTGGALVSDYLARDMSFKPVPTMGPTYQPTIDTPTYTVSPNLTGPITAVPATLVANCTFFYSLTSSSSGYAEVPPSGYFSIPSLTTAYVYAARSGYKNSAVVSIVNPNP